MGLLGRSLTWVRRYLVACVEIDTRILAVFRILVGVLIIGDLLSRARGFATYYTEAGVVPNSLAQHHTVDHAFSVYFFTSSPTITAALFVVSGIVAVQLILGYRTTFATIVSFLLVVSLDHRNILLTSYADTLFRFLVFWAMFLPLGERWSVDARQRSRTPRRRVANLATAAILTQMVYMYVVNWHHKQQNELWTSGEATVLIFGLDDMTILLAEAMRSFPELLRLGGLAWYFLLLASPLLLVTYGRARIPLLSLLMIGHVAFAATVRIGAFPYVAIAGVLLFVQPRVVDDAVRLLRRFGVGRLAPQRSPAARAAAWLPPPRLDAPETPPTAVRVAHQLVVTSAIVVVLVIPGLGILHDAGHLGSDPDPDDLVSDTTAILGIRQPPWSVFAPNPRRTDRYYVFPALTADGERWDVYYDRPLTFERPDEPLHRQYDHYRERFYMNSVRRAGMDGRASTVLAEHLCDTWGADGGVELTHVNLYVVNETVTRESIDDFQGREVETEVIHRHGCGDNEPMEIAVPYDDATDATDGAVDDPSGDAVGDTVISPAGGTDDDAVVGARETPATAGVSGAAWAIGPVKSVPETR